VACLSSFPSCVLQGKDEEHREEKRGRRLHQHRPTDFLDTGTLRKKEREEQNDGGKEKKENLGYLSFYLSLRIDLMNDFTVILVCLKYQNIKIFVFVLRYYYYFLVCVCGI